MPSEYDVYLNGKGYMLAKSPQGELLAGSITRQESDPFTRHLAEEERWKIASFRFSEGGGALKHDGTKRYAFGENVDTRSGDWMRGPEAYRTGTRALDYRFNNREGNRGAVGNIEVSSVGGDHDGYAVRFTTNAPHTEIRSVGLLVRRQTGIDYGAAAAFTVEIRADSGGGVPGAAAVAGGAATVQAKATEQPWLPHENLWIGEEYFWLEVEFPGAPTPIVVVATGTYWLCLMNANATPINWAETPLVGGLAGTIASWNGAAWTAASDQVPYYVVRYADDVDGFTRAFATFRGTDTTRRVYAAVGCKVMYWDDATSVWLISKDDFPGVVHDLIDYDSELYAAVGDGNDIWWDTGATAAGVWTNVAGQQAQCFALHDNLLWKADVASIKGTIDGHGAGTWAGAAVIVGDARTPVNKMVSHGGKLYCAKAEGIFEITYADGYPNATEPDVNMIHDFRSDRYGRNFILDWHSGCYWSGPGGVYEWKSGVLQDVWRQRFKQDADGTPLLPTYTDRKGEFRAAHGSTRGMLFGSYNAHCNDDGVEHPGGCHLHWFDGRYFHSLYSSVYVGEPIHAVFVESRGEGWSRLWWGQGFDIYYIDWPTWTDDRSADARCEFFSASPAGKDHPTLWTPWVDDDKPEILKDWHAVKVHCENVGVQATTEGGTITVYYYNDDGSRTSLGTITGNSDPDNVLYFPADTTGYRLQLELVANTISDQAYTFRVYAIELLYQPLYDTIVQHHVTIRVADNLELRASGHDIRSGATIAEELSALFDEAEPWTYIDELGVSQCVRAVGGTRQGSKIERLPSPAGSIQIEGTVVLTMLEVADTCPS